MSHKSGSTTYYEKLLFLFKNAAAFMPLAMVPFGLLARSELVDSRFYSGDLAFGAIIVAYAAVSIFNFWYNRKFPHSAAADLAFTIIYHVLTLLFILFVSGFLSAFLSVWIILMISTDLRFGTRGFFSSFAGLCLAGALTFLAHPDIPTGEKFEIVQGALVVGAIGFIIAKIRGITDHERTSLAKTRQKESYQRERLLALVNSMGDAVVATDEEGMIKVYNSTLLGLLGITSSLTDQSIDEVLRLQDGSGKAFSIVPEAQLRHTVFSRTDLSRRPAESEVMHLYVNVAPIQPGHHRHAERGFIFILRDITKEKTLEEQRNEFVSVVSHELRTPVTIAEAALSNLLMEAKAGRSDANSTAKLAGEAHKHVRYLAKMVNDLATLSRVERGAVDEVELVDVVAVLKDTYDTYLPQAQSKKLRLILDVAPDLPAIRTSPLYFKEILQNLLTNAIKYTKTGTVTMRATADTRHTRIAVIDTGIGISKSDQQHIFQKFYRSEDYRTRETGGTGLGLYISQKLAEKIGMRLAFESHLNQGTAFTLTIPNRHAAITKEPLKTLTK